MRTPRCLTTVALAAAAALAVAAAPATPAQTGVVFESLDDALRFDTENMADCTQFVPRQTPGVAGVTDSGDDVRLDVLVLLDTSETLAVATALRDAATPAEKAVAESQFAALVDKYQPQVAAGDQSYDAVDVSYDLEWDLYAPFEANGAPRDRSATNAKDSQKIIDRAKVQFGGVRPAGADIVYVLTDQDIFAPGVGNGVAGQADCIGGVEWDEHAFAVGEIFPAISIPGIKFYREGTAKVMAHEIGHLMGAHHHYQSCGPHAVGEALAGGFGACSLMTNFVDFTTFEFSALNGSIVRANAVDHAHQS